MVVWRVVTRSSESASDGGSRSDCEGGVLVYEIFVVHTYKGNANSVVIQRVVNVQIAMLVVTRASEEGVAVYRSRDVHG